MKIFLLFILVVAISCKDNLMKKDKRNKPNVGGGQDIVAEQSLNKANDDSYQQTGKFKATEIRFITEGGQ